MNGGKEKGNDFLIPANAPVVVKFEKSFKGLFPQSLLRLNFDKQESGVTFRFNGTGFVIRGNVVKWDSEDNFNYQANLLVDGKLVQQIGLPVNYKTRKYEIAWLNDLPKGEHQVRLKYLNSEPAYPVNVNEAVIYSETAATGFTSP